MSKQHNWATRLARVLANAVIVLALAGCKERLNPHVAPEGDPEVIVAGMLASARGNLVRDAEAPAPTNRIRLTINNAPLGHELIEQELVQQLVRMFEQQNPDIQIEFSTWRFTPESFYERARNRALTDIIEISIDQAETIIGLSYAADLTELLVDAPIVKELNPATLGLLTKDGRLYGLPTELHSMALFYNRQLLEEALRPAPPDQKPRAPDKDTKKKGKGGNEEWNAETLTQAEAAAQPLARARERNVAQWRRSGRSYYDYSQASPDNEEDQPSYSRRGEQQIENDYQLPTQRRTIWPFRSSAQQRRIPVFGRPRTLRDQTPAKQADEEDLESAAPGTSKLGQKLPEESDIESARPQAPPTVSTTPKDIVTTTGGEETVATVVKEEVTTAVKVEGLPQNWEDFIKLAVKLTDHSKGQYGYAPILFAQEGGREFVQWGVQAGMEIQRQTATGFELTLRGQAAADVLSFLKDLHWRYDVIPPPEKCYADNVMRMFADGKVAMVMLPARRDTIRQLMRMGMALDSIGVAALPAGPQSRDHLVFGNALILNSQLDRQKRAAAVRWLLFQLEPEVQRLREQYYFREQDLTGIPRVPLYAPAKQAAINALLRPYRAIPIFADYEDVVAFHLRPEPPHFTQELYEDLAKDVRKVVEQRELSPATIVPTLGLDFEKQYLKNAPTQEGLERYLRMFSRK